MKRISILLGDFNNVRGGSDPASEKVYIDISAMSLQDAIDDYNLIDVGHLKISSRSLKYTDFQGASHARLDRTYLSVCISNHVCKYFLIPCPSLTTLSLLSN